MFTVVAFPINGVPIWTARVGYECATEALAANGEVLLASSGVNHVFVLKLATAIQY